MGNHRFCTYMNLIIILRDSQQQREVKRVGERLLEADLRLDSTFSLYLTCSKLLDFWYP